MEGKKPTPKKLRKNIDAKKKLKQSIESLPKLTHYCRKTSIFVF